MKISWDDSDSSSSGNEDKKESLICLMTKDNIQEAISDDEVCSYSSSSSSSCMETYEEQYIAICTKYKKLASKYLKLKEEHENYLGLCEHLNEVNANYLLEIKKERDEKASFIVKNTCLVRELNNLKSLHAHCRISFQKINYARTTTSSYAQNAICNYCMKFGHISSYCKFRNSINNKSSSFVWVRKSSLHNDQIKTSGPKRVWVPKCNV
ncbi:hypothetical protein HPP92_011668 [Vanilla planifolia]|uniref:Uncharacterized protein n=1 Tax=Vanilla planifolia TaxID=51239 RepID=A0A835R3B9_VANPL|nr:hypothetical protein HPP92_011668 [Vanilla planifolia]